MRFMESISPERLGMAGGSLPYDGPHASDFDFIVIRTFEMPMSPWPERPIVILGGGIHGAALARILACQALPVVLVEAFDLAAGATAKSSRLIHGGLRYLEYGDIRLVRESLEERTVLLQAAPAFVQPVRLCIPTRAEWSGLVRSAVGFFGWRRTALGQWVAGPNVARGYWPIRIGLNLYDWLGGASGLPGSAALPLDDPQVPRFDRQRYQGVLAYSDAQMRYPERFVMALLADAVQADHGRGLLAIRTRTRLAHNDSGWELVADDGTRTSIAPRAIINTTGAWGDHTLAELNQPGPPLFGGTKGSHFITWHSELRDALRGQAVYAEADDGRLVFILPFGDGVLVGTTDEAWTGPPEEACATEAELQYLMQAVRDVLGIALERSDLTVHYAGVRPLPRPSGDDRAATSRDHAFVWRNAHDTAVLTLVGGKLTTWRPVAEQIADAVLERLGLFRQSATAERPYPGHDPLPAGLVPGPDLWNHWADALHATPAEIATLWEAFGTRLTVVLADRPPTETALVADTAWSRWAVRWVIAHEWVTRLEDLVERRLMLVFAPRLTCATLVDLAELLVEAGHLTPATKEAAITACAARLQQHYGRTLHP
jgi:glycerol-3-phosphate dehydrogenase